MRFLRFALSAAAVFALLACRAEAAATAPAPLAPKAPTTEAEKTVYALGLMISKNLAAFELTPDEIALVQQAIADASLGKTPAVKIEEFEPKVRALAQERGTQRAIREKEKGAAYAAEAAKKPGALKTESGMIFQETVAGTGASPAATDKVKVHYRGTLIDGTEFDSSIARGQPAEFGLSQVVKCWTEGVQRLKVGGKATLVCPSDLAYGDRGRPSIPPGATLVFEVELLEIVAATPAPKPAAE